MKSRLVLVISAITFVVSLAVSAWAWGQIPDGAQIPIHWGINGEANGYAPKAVGLLLVPGIILLIGLIFAAIPFIDPRREHQERSTTARIWILGATMVLLGGVHVVSVLTVLGARLDIGRVVVIGVSGMFIVIGNFLGKTRSNWFVGIRTPWTLSSERSWSQTHRLGGYLFMAAGVVSIILRPRRTAGGLRVRHARRRRPGGTGAGRLLVFRLAVRPGSPVVGRLTCPADSSSRSWRRSSSCSSRSMGVGLYDLTRPDRRVKGGNKWIWAVVIVLGELCRSARLLPLRPRGRLSRWRPPRRNR